MGKDIHSDRLGFCLIGLVMGAFLTVDPQSSWAQESAEGDEPSAAEDSADAGAGEDEADGAEQGETAESEDGADDSAADDPAPTGTPDSSGPSADNTLDDDFEFPANSLPGPTPARTQESVTGTDDPYESDDEPVAADGAGEDDVNGDDEIETGDPLEGMNRVFFKFNDFLDKLLLKPVAQFYRFVLPDYAEDRVRNVVNNAKSPVILANDILQWKWSRAGNTASRAVINTTLGIGGIWDVAASFGIDRHDEDFGQTLCVWGVKEWVYLYLPFVGPTSPRDLAGKVVDRYFDPLTYYADVVQQINLSDGVTIRWNIDRAGWARISLTAADLIDMRARNIETINEIERTSIDFYTAVRSLYRQSRESACNDGKVDFEELPELEDEFE